VGVDGLKTSDAAASDADRAHEQAAITKTTITPGPDAAPASHGDEYVLPAEPKAALRARVLGTARGQLDAAREPLPGPHVIRGVMAAMLSLMCLLTVGGAILLLLLWQQQRNSGVLTTQLERTWELFDTLVQLERWLAVAVVPVAMAWIVLAVVNVRRATGQRPNPVIAALTLPIGIAGIWYVGTELVKPSEDIVSQAGAYLLQCVFLLIPLVAMLRVAVAAESRHRPLRAATIACAVFLAQFQFLAALPTVDQNAGPDEWGPLGAYLVMAALIQVLATLAINEGARSIEEGTDHRYQLRSRFGESLLAQAAQS
jgi:hypothetical protein